MTNKQAEALQALKQQNQRQSELILRNAAGLMEIKARLAKLEERMAAFDKEANEMLRRIKEVREVDQDWP
jgi:hypothetical protein